MNTKKMRYNTNVLYLEVFLKLENVLVYHGGIVAGYKNIIQTYKNEYMIAIAVEK